MIASTKRDFVEEYQMEIILKPYDSTSEKTMIHSIIAFFRVHHSQISDTAARENLAVWTKEDHELYDILGDGVPVGFLHLNWRGSTVCWIEDIFVEEGLRRQGIASKAIGLVEEVLQKRGVEGICMDVIPDRNRHTVIGWCVGYSCAFIIQGDCNVSNLNQKFHRNLFLLDRQNYHKNGSLVQSQGLLQPIFL